MPRYDLTEEQLNWVRTSKDSLAVHLRDLIGMYQRQPDPACLGLMDGAVSELKKRWPEVRRL